MTVKLNNPDLELLRNMPISIGNKVYNYDPTVYLVINQSFQSINETLIRIPGDFALWAFMESMARVVQEEVENQRTVLHAKLYRKYEKELASTQTGRGPTVDTIKSAIAVDAEYQAMLKRVRDANHAVNNLQAMRQAMQQKKDVAMAIAHNLRAEREAHLGDQLKHIRDKVHATRVNPPPRTP